MTQHTITKKQQLVEYFENACKPKSAWRIGTEHEKFLFDNVTKKRLGYDTNPGIRDVLLGLQSPTTTPMMEGDNIIGLKLANGGSITLEPGGQFELSGAPLATIHETHAEIYKHIQSVNRLGERLNIKSVCLGYDPISTLADIHWMPKGRYDLMRAYMPKKGTLGLEMMTLSSTVQVNLDYGDALDMRKKMQVSNALQPLATALWANSTIRQGQLSPYQSYRSHIWTHTDADRCGIPSVVFDADFGFEKWVDYMLDVPMYFVYENGVYHDALGLSFRDFMRGTLRGFEGRLPTWDDWENHLTVAFPEVRMKGFIEMRGADTGCLDMLCALPAFWVGLLYDTHVLDTVHTYIQQFSYVDIMQCRNQVPYQGLNAPMGNICLYDVAKHIIQYAQQGLKSRKKYNTVGDDERIYLYPLLNILKTGINRASHTQNIFTQNMSVVCTDTIFSQGQYVYCE